MPTSKQFADLLTAFRALIAGILTWLGLTTDKSSLPLAVHLMMASWNSDYFDGTLARRATPTIHTWLGDHDLIIDMAASFGLLVYLTGVGFLSPAVSLTYLVVWLFVFWQFGISNATGSLFQAPIYGLLLWLAANDAPEAAIWALYWIAGALLFSWRRFWFKVIPEFLHGISEAFRHHAQ